MSKIKKAKFIVESIGPGIFTHNYVCSVCHKNSAVYYANEDVLLPCWDCMKEGYFLIKVSKITAWILSKLRVIL